MKDPAHESDWKRFCGMVPELRERYLSARNAELSSILSNPHLSQTERFWRCEERTKEIAAVLRACLDGHTRSSMESFMRLMITHGMMTVEDIVGFREELQSRLATHLR